METATMKAGAQWEFFGRLFNVKETTFERVVTRFVLLISKEGYGL